MVDLSAGILTRKSLGVARAVGNPIEHVGDVVDAGRIYGRSPLWIDESGLDVLGLGAEPPEFVRAVRSRGNARTGIRHPFVDAALDAGYEIRPAGLAPWMVGWSEGARVDVAVAPWLDGFEGATGAEILATLERFDELVGVPYMRSPGATSARLLRAVHRRGTPLEPSAEPVPPAADRSTEVAFRWWRAPELEERGRRFVHAIDANGLYLAAASTVELGFGEPEHLIPKGNSLGFDPKLPGYWRATIACPNAQLPDPFDPMFREGFKPREPRWFATPTVELGMDLGVVRELHEAYVFPRHHRFLEPWYVRLRNARRALIDEGAGAARALRLVKWIYQRGLGNLAGYFHETGDELFRPDWYHAVVARARANLYRRILKIPHGVGPFAVDVDCLYVASDIPDARLAIPGLPIGDELGQFKIVGTAKLSDAIEAFDARNPIRALSRLVKGA